MRQFIAPVLLPILILLAWPAAAQAEERFVTVYGDGRALVRELRQVELPERGPLPLSGVAATIRPETVAVRSLSHPGLFAVSGLSLHPGRPEPSLLLELWVGRELTVVLPDPADAQGRVSRRAKLLSAGPNPVFDLGGEIWVGPHLGVLLPGLPEGVAREPTLRLEFENAGPARQQLELSYMMQGLSWSADYALVLDRTGPADRERGALTAWATIANNSRTPFADAAVRLVAGEVNRAGGTPKMLRAEGAMTMAMDRAAPEPQRTAVGGQHVYSLPGRLDLAPEGITQARLVAAPDVRVHTRLVSRFSVPVQLRPGELEQTVDSELELVNDEASGLGRPLPAGTVRVYRSGPGGAPLLVGEDRMDHTPVGEETVLRLGSSFDVTVRRVQREYRSTGKRSASMTWEITAGNGSDEPRRLRLLERLPGEWTVREATLPYTTPSAGEAAFDLLLPPDAGATTLRYTVDLSW